MSGTLGLSERRGGASWPLRLSNMGSVDRGGATLRFPAMFLSSSLLPWMVWWWYSWILDKQCQCDTDHRFWFWHFRHFVVNETFLASEKSWNHGSIKSLSCNHQFFSTVILFHYSCIWKVIWRQLSLLSNRLLKLLKSVEGQRLHSHWPSFRRWMLLNNVLVQLASCVVPGSKVRKRTLDLLVLDCMDWLWKTRWFWWCVPLFVLCDLKLSLNKDPRIQCQWATAPPVVRVQHCWPAYSSDFWLSHRETGCYCTWV